MSAEQRFTPADWRLVGDDCKLGWCWCLAVLIMIHLSAACLGPVAQQLARLWLKQPLRGKERSGDGATCVIKPSLRSIPHPSISSSSIIMARSVERIPPVIKFAVSNNSFVFWLWNSYSFEFHGFGNPAKTVAHELAHVNFRTTG